MQTLTEKRVFGAKTGTTEVFVATDTGLVVVTVSAEQIGTFGLTYRGSVTAVAADAEHVLLGTDEGLRYSRLDTADRASSPPEFTFSTVGDGDIGRITAVGFGPTGPLVADDAGGVFSVDLDSEQHEQVGETADVRAIDGGLIATADGVSRFDDGALTHVGLDAASDVTGHGVPLAATDDGLFRLGNGWLSVADGPFDGVAGDGHGHASAVGPEGLRTQAETDGEWDREELPVDEAVADLAYGSGLRAAVTEAGTLCITAGDGWRHQRLGLPGVSGVAVAGSESA
ncbi:MAG: hypothetical protein A07HN63_00010 [uncultured archaeon A07HN63]|nr:MAG: hypothetical protein A07HN63_00010 [uncultured archaeon A07HN63]